jgi:predicted tellurium resistance membrane protein TerC
MATVLIYGTSSVSFVFSTGYSMHRGDESMSISLEESSWVLAIFLVYTIFSKFLGVDNLISRLVLCERLTRRLLNVVVILYVWYVYILLCCLLKHKQLDR